MDSEQSFDEQLPLEVRRDLETFRRHVFAEMYYLKDNGGKSYKVTNGVRIGRAGSGFAYCFDLEAELFLSEDAPITVSIGDRKYNGSVLACENFQLTAILATDIGEKVPIAYIHAEPWKLLESLNHHLIRINPKDHPIALRLMKDGPALATNGSIDMVDKDQTSVRWHVASDPITVIWGPPGTGKTHTMAEIAISSIKKGKTVLVVSHSNISVDGVISKVASLMRGRGLDGLLKAGQVMRFGNVRDEGLANDEDVVARNYAIRKNAKLVTQLKGLIDRRNTLNKKGKQRSKEMVEVQQAIKKIQKDVREEEERCVEKAHLVGTTASKLYANKLFEDRTYDLVMFDEVSMAYVPQVICAAMHAREKLVLVGDFRQLAPIAQGKSSKEVLSKDVFSYLRICDPDQKAHYHPWLVMLNEQRRMHPAISAFPSEAFYGGLLVDHQSVIGARDAIAQEPPCPGSPMTYISLRGTMCPAARNSDNSRFNVLSAAVSFGVAYTACADGEKSVGIISPYVAQARLVRAMIQDCRSRGKKADIACSTVHQFQGSERNVIVLDTVESYPAKKAGVLTSNNQNGAVDRLVNVAVTRARGKFVTVANGSFWDPPYVKQGNAFSKLIKHHRKTDTTVSTRDDGLKSLLENLNFGPNIKLYYAVAAHEKLLEDIKKARQKIVVSIPDGKLVNPQGEQLLASLRNASNRGAEVLVKCINWDELPSSWKNHGWQSDDAVFPLIVIDGKTCWYGMPLSRGKMPSHDGIGAITKLSTPLRITGEKTVGMIVSLTELETRQTKDSRQVLKSRTGNASEGATGKASYGLDLYIRQHKKCPKCKAPMKMAKSFNKGIFYLRCTSCDNMEYLDKDFMNHYISASQVRCPKCKSFLHACLGKYGPYIRCDNGHTLKPNEI